MYFTNHAIYIQAEPPLWIDVCAWHADLHTVRMHHTRCASVAHLATPCACINIVFYVRSSTAFIIVSTSSMSSGNSMILELHQERYIYAPEERTQRSVHRGAYVD